MLPGIINNQKCVRMRKTIPGSTIASLTGIAAKRTYVLVLGLATQPKA